MVRLQGILSSKDRKYVMRTNNLKSTPAGYNETSFVESDTIDCLQNLLKNRNIKPHLTRDDKTPNFDGFIEILNDSGIPIGKVTVQVKTLPEGKSKYPCPTKLLGYSQTISEPFLFLCADASSNRAFWKHIEWNMPEAKPNQNSFTLHFSKADMIDSSKNYIQQWIVICDDYKSRISNYPKLKEKLANDEKLPVNADVFQEMSDRINQQLDINWKVLKSRFFVSTWKIGIGIVDDDSKIMYQLFQIPYGHSGELVRKVNKDDFQTFDIHNSNMLSSHINYYSTGWTPQNAANDFIEKYATRALKEYLFKIRGNKLASEIVTSFCRHYSEYLDIKTDKTYDFQEIRHKILSRFMDYRWYNRHTAEFRRIILGNIRCVIKNTQVSVYHDPYSPWPDNKLSKFPLLPLREALDQLNADQLHDLNPAPDIENPVEHPIFGFSDEAEKNRAEYLFENLVQSYQKFIQGNGLDFLDSPYLDSKYSIVFFYAPRPNKEAGPNRRYVTGITEIYVFNEKNNLPKSISIIADSEDDFGNLLSFKDGKVNIENGEYKFSEVNSSFGECLLSSMPLFTTIYQILKRDIERYFKSTKAHSI